MVFSSVMLFCGVPAISQIPSVLISWRLLTERGLVPEKAAVICLYLERSCLDSILYKFFPKSVSFRTIPEIYWSLERQERENVNRVWEGGNRWGFTLAEIWIRAPWGWHRLQGLQEEQILKSKSSWALPFITWYFLLLWFLLFFLWFFPHLSFLKVQLPELWGETAGDEKWC